MDIAFVVSLPSDLERFLPLARRLPGAEFVLAPGRWPSAWLDSRRWTAQALRREQLHSARPRRQFSLLVAGPGIAPRSLRPWLRPGGRLLPWTAKLNERFGDPRLAAANEPGAAARARHRLGVGAERPIWLAVVDELDPASQRCFGKLASYRSEAEWLVVASQSAWLRSPRPMPPALAGPGIRVLRQPQSWAELLAAADGVVGNDRAALCDAIELAVPALLIAGRPESAGHSATSSKRQAALLDLLPISFEAEHLPRALLELSEHWREREAQRARLCPPRRSAERAARALARAHAKIAIERVLRSLC